MQTAGNVDVDVDDEEIGFKLTLAIVRTKIAVLLFSGRGMIKLESFQSIIYGDTMTAA